MSNRLAAATSPYLLQHAHNPVDWQPWDAEALALARSQDRPIFLSIGYAACHWCHVMAHESFEDPQTAAFLNAHFVSIKVDREERPDLDALYMDAVVALTGQGGWPMSVFLTPDGQPFYGGTYFPPVPRHSLPAFRQVLEAIWHAWNEDRGRLLHTGAELTRHVSETLALPTAPDHLEAGVLSGAAERLLATYDWTEGGWGPGPKFPQPMAIGFLLRRHQRDGDRLARDMAVHALHAMARGGIFDQIGGGFHRYATDRRWRIPHFEKMLYDNALLSAVYLQAWQTTSDAGHRRTLESTLDFVLRELGLPQGGFASSLDADSGGGEGDFYLWSPAQVEAALGDRESARLVCLALGVTEQGDVEGRSVLRRALTLEELGRKAGAPSEQVEAELREAAAALFAARADRPPPARDDKVVAEWNGLLLCALAEAGSVLDRADYRRAALRLGEFALQHLYQDGRLARSWRDGRRGPPGYLADYAALGLGCLALYQCSFDPRWFAAAVDLAEKVLERFSDPRGGFHDTGVDHEALIARPKSLQDNAVPSGNALALELLLRLAALTGDGRYTQASTGVLGQMQTLAGEHPLAFGAWLSAIDFALGPQLQLAIVGRPEEAAFAALVRVARDRYQPRLVLGGGDPGDTAQPSLVRGRSLLDDRPTAYLCRSFACQLPTTSAEELRRQLAQAESGPAGEATSTVVQTDVQ